MRHWDERTRTRGMTSRPLWTLIAAILLLCAAATAGAEQPVTIRLWNFNIHDKKYQQKMYKLFGERNPGIKIEYSSISSTVCTTVLEASFAAKEPPDLFLPTGNLNPDALRMKGLIMALDDCAPGKPEMAAWKARFPPALAKFVEGMTVFDGKVYIIDTRGDTYNHRPLFFNTTLFKEAGIEKPPATYSQLIQDAAKVTASGQGKYFGVVHGLANPRGGLWAPDLTWSLALAGGTQKYLFDLKDGRYHYDSPEFRKALNVWIRMRMDGSVFPGELQMDDEQAKMTFATNKAALQFGGWWNPGNYLAYGPDCAFDVVLPPTPDDGIWRGYYYREGSLTPEGITGGEGYVISSAVKDPRAAWKVIEFISSLEYQQGYVKGGYGFSYLPEANTPENFSIPLMYKFVKWAIDPTFARIAPSLSEEAKKAWALVPGIYPTETDVLTNIYLGHSDFDALADLDRRSDAAVDEGIRKARENGVKVSRDDFVFPDWDHSKDYVPKKK